ncbi:hypothetical protein [Comamonas sp. JC664]|uniref:hypothetical protein n=1 Tax=Comamonas sp. JC664 TaxID=2801917 RepID=UPI001748388B|nr:hypothetical protein [Comamonas sp. JC664]MBL0694849.1 hypothetical protein [Comamonas sp. JC664]GHG94891.1 hypothetical protein GCM10012319_58250 [Comamonas sp. KCTC 72670]
MQVFKSAVWFCAAVSLAACGAPEESAGEESLAQQDAALTTGTTQGCTYSITSTTVPGTVPPRYSVSVTRAASSTCPWPEASVTLDSGSYVFPARALLANSLGIAVTYTGKYSPSGSAPVSCGVRHLHPETLAVVRSEGIAVFLGSGNINSCHLDQTDGGATLVVYGTKGGRLYGETGSGSNYVATYYDFFTSTTPPVFYAY